ncbi:Zinc finger protein 84 [Oopsacas minuta]|uniref:Zinc finger protein 84 n=1 Tax=Oopsacas minuta TaxID=111878 RepID=A0AAV7KC83_9METZ|nr:Zinc finger protein 84 [Oopsacas minuta]
MDTQILSILRSVLPGVEHFIQETLAYESLSDSARIEWAVLIQHLTKLQHNKISLEECITQIQTQTEEQDNTIPVLATSSSMYESNILPNTENTEVLSNTVVSSADIEQVHNLKILLNEEKSENISLENSNASTDTEQSYSNLTFSELLNPLNICTDSANSDLSIDCNNESFLEQYTMDADRQFICSVCSRKFAKKQHLRQHLIAHSGDKPFKCSFCVRQFIYPSLLRDHLKLHLNPPHPCTHCSKKFIHKKALYKHMQIHTSDKPFSCIDCGKSFRTRLWLNMHINKCHVLTTPSVVKDVTRVMPATIVNSQPIQQKIEPIIIQDSSSSL